MKKSALIFHNGIIDYAGLYPPAKLSLHDSLKNYSAARKGRNNWILNRFVIGSGLLKELDEYRDNLLTDGEPFRLSVVGTYEPTVEGFQQSIDDALLEIEHLHQSNPGWIATESFEIKLPDETLKSEDPELLEELIHETSSRFEQVEFAPEEIYYEMDLNENWKNEAEMVFQVLAQHQTDLDNHFEQSKIAGFKMRCGGVTKELFPSVEQLAHIICLARDFTVPIKFTAGLHHPVRHYDENIETHMHGFWNVFGATMLAYTQGLEPKEIENILEEEDVDVFTFTEEGFSCKRWRISMEEIEQLREIAVLTFGSCSIDEPLDDMKLLKVI